MAAVHGGLEIVEENAGFSRPGMQLLSDSLKGQCGDKQLEEEIRLG